MAKTAESELLFIPAGELEMGISSEVADRLAQEFLPLASDANPYLFYTEVPAHKVAVPAFKISRFEVTNREFMEFVKAGGYTTKNYWKELLGMKLNTDLAGWDRVRILVDSTGTAGPATWANGTFPAGRESHPVDGVSWFEATAYCRWKKLRLPSEAEWEYAARGTDGRLYPWGNNADVVAKWGTRQAAATTPAGAIAEDKSPFGLMDLARNVAEWVEDPWASYPGTPMAPQSAEDEYGIIRGGTFTSIAYEMRTTYRRRVSRLERRPGIGFRCAARV